MFGKIEIPEKISYKSAIKQKPKEGSFYICTSVTWDGAPEDYLYVEFETLGSCKIRAPIKLPAGYSMVWHSTWVKTAKALYYNRKSEVKTFDFEKMDALIRDWQLLEDVTGIICEWDVYELRPDYLDWSLGFDKQWAAMEEALEKYCNSVIDKILPTHIEPFSLNIGNRTSPPSAEQIFTLFQDYIANGNRTTNKEKFMEIFRSCTESQESQ